MCDLVPHVQFRRVRTVEQSVSQLTAVESAERPRAHSQFGSGSGPPLRTRSHWLKCIRVCFVGPLGAPPIDLRQSLDTRSRPPSMYLFRISKATVEEGEQDAGALHAVDGSTFLGHAYYYSTSHRDTRVEYV